MFLNPRLASRANDRPARESVMLTLVLGPMSEVLTTCSVLCNLSLVPLG